MATTRGNRALLDVHRADIDGNTRGGFEAAQILVDAEPAVPLSYVYLGNFAVRLNRPRAAIEAVSHRTGRPHHESVLTIAVRDLTAAYHALGQHGKELAEAHSARKLYPENPDLLFFELRAQAARDQVREMQPLLAQLEQTPTPNQTRVPDLLIAIAGELRYHGHPKDAERVLARAVEWQRARSPQENQTIDAQYTLATALYLLGRYGEAASPLEVLARNYPNCPFCLAASAAGADRLGKPIVAEQITKRLNRLHPPYDRGETPYALAQLAAQRGDTNAALTFLERSFREGWSQAASRIHGDLMLSPLWENARFKELLRPKE